MKNVRLIFALLIFIAIFSGCNQIKLSNEEAKSLIVTTLKLPITYRHDVNKRPSMGSGFELDGLRNAGLITGSEYLDSRRLIEIQITELGESSFMGENNSAYMFKTNDIDFDNITGISINKEEQTATVRFSLKANNVTLAAYALAKTNAGFSGKKYINYSLINPLNGELVFKKFDNGWQLLEQGKSSSDLLKQILDSEVNSNKQDDYSQLTRAKHDEIYGNNKSTQAHYTDIEDFYKALKTAVLSKDMNEVSKFLNFPFFCDYGVISKKEFLSEKFTLGIKYFDIFTRNEPLFKFGDGSYGLIGPPQGPDLMIVKDNAGFWKLNDYLINEVRGD